MCTYLEMQRISDVQTHGKEEILHVHSWRYGQKADNKYIYRDAAASVDNTCLDMSVEDTDTKCTYYTCRWKA